MTRRSAPTALSGFVRLVLLLAVSGCFTPGRVPPSGSTTAAGRNVSAVRMAQEADAWTRAAFRRCGQQTPGGKPACYEAELVSLLRSGGPAAAMAALDHIAAIDADVGRDGHVYAHAIGLAAYDSAAGVGAAFARCTPAHQSGCYHGVIQAYFRDLDPGAGLGAEAINALCQDHRASGASRWLLFQCVHGMGHGLTMLHGHDLPRALEGCDLLADAWEREGCYGGAFMESLVNATAPHHPAASAPRETASSQHEHGDAHAHHPPGHEHSSPASAAEAEPFRALDPADPHHPCSALDARYLRACYAMQTSAVLFRNGGDIPAAATFCDEAPAEVRDVCFASLGRDISSRTLRGHDESVRMCGLVPEPHQPWCHTGVVKNIVDQAGDPAEGFAYCATVPGQASQTRCYEAVGEQLWIIEPGRPARESWCERAGPAFAGACRAGAGLAEPNAAGLPSAG